MNVQGFESLLKKLDMVSDTNKLFDREVGIFAIDVLNKLTNETPQDTGRVRRAWQRPKKLAPSKYSIVNDYASQDKKYAIAQILNDGRGLVTPKKARRLYIPLSKRAKYKKLGAAIPSNFKYGIDYVFAKKSKAVKGTKYIDKITEKKTKELSKLISKRIRSLLGGSIS